MTTIQTLNFGDNQITSSARIEGQRLLFENGPMPIQILLLPDGASCNTPLKITAGHPFVLEVGCLLSPLGTVEISKEVSDETRQIDVFFSPNPEPNPDYLGLLGRIVLNTVLIEPYRNPPNRSEIRNCLAKLLTILAELQRQAKRENQSYNEDNAPRLLALGLSVEQVASALELEVKQVRAMQKGT